MFYNDVWAYRICPRSAAEDIGDDGQHLRGQRRWADQPCVGEGWVLWHPGAREGGYVRLCCIASVAARTSLSDRMASHHHHFDLCSFRCLMERGLTVCTTPSERYNHGAAMFNDGTMYVYGGFSQRCVDYCDDLWFFDIYIKAWREIYYAGAHSASVSCLRLH